MKQKDVKHDLEFYPKLRERANKNRYIAIKIERKYHTGIPIDKLTEIVMDSWALDRAWRSVLQNNPRLRGTDYGDKKVLENNKKQELGYEGGRDVSEFQALIDSF